MKVLAVLLFCSWLSSALSGDATQMTDKLATKYVIGIDTDATTQEADKDADTSDKVASCRGMQEDMLQHQAKTSEQILNALSARCLYRLEDRWTYELCYEKHVRQFHKEEDIMTTEYLLGEFEGNAADTDTLEGSSKNTGSQYVKQIYTNGDACDLTASTRQTEVRYTCGEGAHEVITSIKEPSTCHYVLSVSIPGLCQLPSFRQKTEPISLIVCKSAPAQASSASSRNADAAKQHQQEPAETVEEAADLNAESSSNETATA